MKKFKKFSAMVSAILMAGCMMMNMNAFATAGDGDSSTSQTYSISVSTEKGEDGQVHTFEAYQIFEGTLNTGTDGTELTVTGWGSGVDGDALLTALQNANFSTALKTAFSKATTAAEIAQAISDNDVKDDSADAYLFADIVAQHLGTKESDLTKVAPGYYLMIDTTELPSEPGDRPNGENTGAYSRHILKVVDDVDIVPKADAPTVVKKVKEDDKYQGTEYGEGFNDVADYSIGEDIEFKLIGTLPCASEYKRYNNYQYNFYDTLESGKFGAITDVKITISGLKEGTDDIVLTNSDSTKGLTITNSSATDGKLNIAFTDLKKYVTDDIITDNTTVTVTYKSKLVAGSEIGQPGQRNEVYLTYSNNPNHQGTGTPDDTTGKTPVDKVIVFTYELDITKIDGNTKKKLNGVQFSLKDESGNYIVIDATGKVTGLSEDKVVYDTKNFTNTGDGAEAEGLIKIIGLDDGVYTLTEEKEFDGYSKLDNPLTLTITAITANGQGTDVTGGTEVVTDKGDLALTKLTLDVTDKNSSSEITNSGDVASGLVSLTIKNNKGSSLPSTGGIGTTIFYLTGGVLVVGAGVLLISKKRMQNNEQAEC